MIKLYKKEELNLLSEYPKEVVENVDNIINILDENYGYNRKLTDDGGYVCTIEDIKDIENLKSNILKGLLEEFSDIVSLKLVKESSVIYETITNRLQKCGELLGIELVDHIIVGDDDKYFSFKENFKI